MEILKLNDVHCKIGNAPILSNISFSIEHGDNMAIIGPNGSGKSTLIKLISGELRPSQGEIIFKNKNILFWNHSQLSLHRSVLSQSCNLSFPFSVTDIIKMGRYPFNNNIYENSVEEKNIIDTLLECFDLKEFAARNYLTLSGGEKQRVQLARVFSQIWNEKEFDQKMLILDEPNSFLDIRHQIKLFEMIRNLNGKGLTIIMVLHDINHALYHSSKVVMLKKAELKYFGKVGKVINKQNVSDVFNVHPDSDIYNQSLLL